MPAQFSVDASIKGAERVSFGYIAPAQHIFVPFTASGAFEKQPTLQKNKRMPLAFTRPSHGHTHVFSPRTIRI